MQTEFAVELGMTHRAYQYFESGERVPKGDTLQRIVQTCGVSTDWLLTGKGQRNLLIMSIGQRIKEYREELGLKIKPFSDLIAISQGALSNIENDKTAPSAKTIEAIVRNTDINPFWLLTGEGAIKKERITPTIPVANNILIMSIGQRIKKYREELGLKIRPFSDLIAISHSALSDIENDKTAPSAKTIEAIVRNTDINPFWLLTGEGNMERESKERTIPVQDKDCIAIGKRIKTIRGKVSALAFAKELGISKKDLIQIESGVASSRKLDMILRYVMPVLTEISNKPSSWFLSGDGPKPFISVGARLKEIREKMQLSQQSFADTFGIRQSWLSELEQGIKKPSDTFLITLEFRHKININWLLTGEGEMERHAEPTPPSIPLDTLEIIIEALEGQFDVQKLDPPPSERASFIRKTCGEVIKFQLSNEDIPEFIATKMESLGLRR